VLAITVSAPLTIVSIAVFATCLMCRSKSSAIGAILPGIRLAKVYTRFKSTREVEKQDDSLRYSSDDEDH
jgi:hypothetical protein